MRLLLILLLFSAASVADNWVYLELCSMKHGGKPDKVLSGQDIRGDAWIKASNIMAIIPHYKFEQCTLLFMQNGVTLSFLGSPIEMACKISRAPSCNQILQKK